ncbi:hypothetical protein E4T45_03240 [Aureobasidium sp. EXF-8846]|nr:hypothetical protein E4T45_03240 [Aureobasidium sp. EXF-8846]
MSDPGMALNCSIAKAEAIHLEHQSLALQNLYPDQGYSTKHVAGSITTLARPEFGWKLNHTSGFAVFGKVTSDDLRTIEAAYERNGISPRIDIINISILGPEDHDTFVKASNEGFRSGGRPPELLRVLAESAAARPDTTLFSASIEGELVGTAGMAMVNTGDKKIVVLYIDSCLPSARGRGVHKALLLERLRVARDRGFDLACATAREGSISAKNMEKVGFTKAYSCNIYTKNS